MRLLPPSLAELTARSLNLQWAVPGKGQLRIDEALGVLSCTKRCSLVWVVLPASEFLPLSRYMGGGGLCLFPYLTMPNLEGSIRFPPPPKYQELVLLLGRVEPELGLAHRLIGVVPEGKHMASGVS